MFNLLKSKSVNSIVPVEAKHTSDNGTTDVVSNIEKGKVKDGVSFAKQHRSSLNLNLDVPASPSLLAAKKKAFRSGSSNSFDNNIDIKSGYLLLIEYKNSEECISKVFVKVIGNSYEHHAQIYTDSKMADQLGYISLRNCEVNIHSKRMNTISIVVKGCADATNIVQFIASSEGDAIEWANAFIPRTKLAIRSANSPVPMLFPRFAQPTNNGADV